MVAHSLHREGGEIMKKEHERVPVRETRNTKKRYGKHREGAVPLTIWEDNEFKEFIRKDAKRTDLPGWSLSSHIGYILRSYYGLWDKPYKPRKG